jgi:hypothetical protein
MVSVAGIMAMVAAAWLLGRFKALPDRFVLPKAATSESA